jgi:glycosyltransferase involved in cell wall biosynthesis
MSQNPILKVVWICYFSNSEIRKILNPLKEINDIAPWITSLIKIFESRRDVELHIISPHEYISTLRYFVKTNIHYHFFNAHIPIFGRHWPTFFKFDDWTDFYFNKHTIKKLVNKINPDILHLHGAENAFYSSSILQFRNTYPVVVTIQGFISHEEFTEHPTTKIRIKYEQRIIKSFKHFGYRTEIMRMEIKKINPQAVLHWHNYLFQNISPLNLEKRFDLVFFARITKEKGVEDLIKTMSLLKRQKENISLCMIGAANEPYLAYLRKQVSSLDLDNNIYWAGFLPTQKDVYTIASSAKICVLPSLHDIIPGTIIESMFLGIPVVAYNVGSIYEINNEDDIICLIEKGNIEALADTIFRLLMDKKELEERSRKGIKRAVKMFDNSSIFNDLMNAYKVAINDFKLN